MSWTAQELRQIRYLEIAGLIFTVFFFWLVGDEKLLRTGQFSSVDFANLLFTFFGVFTSWWIFKQLLKRLSPMKAKLSQINYYLIQLGLTLPIIFIYIYLINWIYIYVIFKETFADNYFIETILPLAVVFSVVWNLIDLLFDLITTLKDIKSKQRPDPPKTSTPLLVKKGSTTRILPWAEIAFLGIKEKIVWAITLDGEKYLVDQNLNQIEQQVDNAAFFRINRQIILSRTAVIQTKPLANHKLEVIFKSISNFPDKAVISRYNTTAFKKWLKN